MENKELIKLWEQTQALWQDWTKDIDVSGMITNPQLLSFLTIVFHALLVMVGLLIFLAFALYMDRKVWAAVQMRRGPNVVGVFGLLQSFADFLKFVLKEPLIPDGANRGIFLMAPLVVFLLAMSSWAIIPFASNLVFAEIDAGILYFLAISSLSVYGIIMGGWASNSKYAFLGAMRSAAQMISYEVSIGFIVITVLLAAGSLNLVEIVRAQENLWFVIPLFPVFVLFFICALAETNRPPFDLPEAESEIVAGYMVEYSSSPYLLFMIGELAAVILMCAMATVLFLGGWLPIWDIPALEWIPDFGWFFIKTLTMFFLFAMVKAIVPRYRYDQLMRLGWKIFLPLSLVFLVATASVLLFIKEGVL